MVDVAAIRSKWIASKLLPFGDHHWIRSDQAFADIGALCTEIEQLRAKVEWLTWENVPHSHFDKLEGKMCRFCWVKYPEHQTDCPAAERGEE